MKALPIAALVAAVSFNLSGQTFTNSTISSGAQAVNNLAPSGMWRSGVSFVDLDGDGNLDYFISAHGGGNAVAGLGDGNGHFTPVTSGNLPPTEIHIPYDVNEDGKLDFSMTWTDGGGQWWTNNSTPGSVNFIAAGDTRGNARQQSIADINKDGKVDWLIGVENQGINIGFGTGSGTFAANSKTIAIPSPCDGMAPIPVDLDNDGNKELIVQWGRYDYENGRTRIYKNDGNGNFTDITTACGLYQDNLAILGFGDFDNDGDIDLIGLENKQFPESIFLNDGAGHFTKKSGAVTGSTGAASYASWGIASFTDIDNDGIQDLIVGGRNYTHILRGTGGGNFTSMNTAWGIPNTGAAAVDNTYAFGDIDKDGDLDIAILPTTGDPMLFRNDLPAKNWVNVRPVGLAGNKGASGSKIRLYAPGTAQLLAYEEVLIYCKQAQQNYYAYAATERHYGLGDRTGCDVEVEFYPSGKKVKTLGVRNNVTVTINENGTANQGTVGIVEKTDGERPKAPGIEAWPNPFTKDVRLQVSTVNQTKSIHLEIRNATGKLVAALMPDVGGPTSGYTWNASGMPVGVYLARLSAGGSVFTKRITLVR